MTRKEKEKHISKYNTELLNTENTSRFNKHVQHFLEYESSDDEAIAEILDFMYAILILQNDEI